MTLTLEDFPAETKSFENANPYSTVGLQFIVAINGQHGSCNDVPRFTASTPSSGECFEVQIGSAYNAVIEVTLADFSRQ